MFIPSLTNCCAPTSPHDPQKSKESGGEKQCNVLTALPEPEKVSNKYSTLKEIRDWALATVFLLWGGQSIYDRNFKPNLNDENFQAVVKILDKDGDGRLSKQEIEEAKKLLEEVKKLKSITDLIGGFTGKK